MPYTEPDPAYLYEAPKPDWMYQAHVSGVSQTDSGKYSVTIESPDPKRPQTYSKNGTPHKRCMSRYSFYCSRETWAKYHKLMELQMVMPMHYALDEVFA